MNERFIKAIVVGILLGLATEYVIRPYFEKPVEKAVEKAI